MKNSKCLLLSLLVLSIIGCEQPSEDGSSSADQTPSPGSGDELVVEKSRFSYDEGTQLCLNDLEVEGYNENPASENDGECVDFSHKDLSNRDFSNMNLQGANFEGAILNGVRLDGARLKGIKIRGVEIDSEWLLQWLISGRKPKKVEEIEEDLNEEEDETVIADGNDEIPEIDDSEEPGREPYINSLEEMVDHYALVQEKVKFDHRHSQLAAASLRLRKSLLQSVNRVMRKQVRFGNHQKRLAGESGDEEVRLAWGDWVEEIEGQRKYNRSLIEQKNLAQKQKSEQARAEHNELKRVSKIYNYASRLLRMGFVSDQNGEDLLLLNHRAIALEKTAQLEAIRKDIEGVRASIIGLRGELEGLNSAVSAAKEAFRSANQQVRQLGIEIGELNKKIKSEVEPAIQQELRLEKEQLVQERQIARENRSMLKQRLVAAIDLRRAPRESLKQYSAELRGLKSESNALKKSIREHELLDKLSQLIG